MILIDLDCFYFLNETPTRITRQTHGHSHGFREQRMIHVTIGPRRWKIRAPSAAFFSAGKWSGPEVPRAEKLQFREILAESVGAWKPISEVKGGTKSGRSDPQPMPTEWDLNDPKVQEYLDIRPGPAGA
jgi:hypothetical protein